MKRYKFFMYILSAMLVVTGCIGLNVSLITPVKAYEDQAFFYLENTDTLFKRMSTDEKLNGVIVRKDDGTGNGPVAFTTDLNQSVGDGLANYYGEIDESAFAWDSLTDEQFKQIGRAMFAFNFVYPTRLEEFGLSADNTIALYYATQTAIWTICGGWSMDDIVSAVDDPSLMDYVANVRNLAVSIYNYAVGDNETFVAGTKLYNATDDTQVFEGDTFDVSGTTTYVDENGVYYYRTPKLSLITSQYNGVAYQGSRAYRYQVELVNAPAGSRIVNENGVPQTEFSTEPGVGTDFFVEVPIAMDNPGTFSVKVSTIEFRRMNPVLYTPDRAEEQYSAIIMTPLIPDSGEIIFNVNYPDYMKGVYGLVKGCFVGEKPTSYTTVDREEGTFLNIEMANQPLTGIKTALYAGRDKNVYDNLTTGTYTINKADGTVYTSDKLYKHQQMFYTTAETPYDNTVNSEGCSVYRWMPLDNDSDEMAYFLEQVSAPDGFYLPGTTTLDNEQEVRISKDSSKVLSEGTTTFVNGRTKFNFEVQLKLGNLNADHTAVESYTPAGAGIKFILSNEDEIPLANGESILPGSWLALLETNDEGKLNSDTLDNIPVGYRYTIFQLHSVNGYSIAETAYLDLTLNETNKNAQMIDAQLTDFEGNPLSEIKIDPKRSGVYFTFEEQKLLDNFTETERFEMVPTDDVSGFKVGIYSDPGTTNLLEEVTYDEDGDIFKSSRYFIGTDLYVKLIDADPKYVMDDNVYHVQIGNNTSGVVFSNDLATGNVTVKAVDITYSRDDVTAGTPQKGVKFIVKYGTNEMDSLTTGNSGEVTFTSLPKGTCYSLVEVAPTGYVAQTEVGNFCLDDDNTTLTRYSYLSEIKGNISVTIKDSETNSPVKGSQISLYDYADTEFANPLAVALTNENGVVLFSDLANKKYVVRETKGATGYNTDSTPNIVDLTGIRNGDTIYTSSTSEKHYANIKLTLTNTAGDVKLAGAVYGLYKKADDTLIESKTTDVNGEITFTKQVYGSEVYVKEITAPSKYKKSDIKTLITMNDVTKDLYTITDTNELIKFSLTIKVVDNDKETKGLAGAKLTLYNATDTNLEHPIVSVVTDSDGKAVISGVTQGKYIISEAQAPEGYNKYNDLTLDFSSIEEDQLLVIKNTKKATDSGNSGGSSSGGNGGGNSSSKPSKPSKPYVVPNTGIDDNSNDIKRIVSISSIATGVAILMLVSLTSKKRYSKK